VIEFDGCAEIITFDEIGFKPPENEIEFVEVMQDLIQMLVDLGLLSEDTASEILKEVFA